MITALLANALSLALYCGGRRVAAAVMRWRHRRWLARQPKSATLSSVETIYKSIFSAEGMKECANWKPPAFSSLVSGVAFARSDAPAKPPGDQ